LFVGGGHVNGIGTPGTLLCSVPGGPTAGTIVDWKDPISGLVNQIVVGDKDDPIVALGNMGRDLVIFKRNSIWLLTGSGLSSFAVRRLTDSLGCISKMSVVSVDEGCFFLSERGYHWIDAAGVVEVSRDIAPTIIPAIAATTTFQFGGGRTLTASQEGFQRAVYLAGGGVLLTMGAETFTAFNFQGASVAFQALYDIKRRTWSKYSSATHSYPLSSTGGITGCYRVGDRSVGFDGWSTFYLDDVMNPEIGTKLDTRLVGADPVNNPALTAAIPAKWHSRLIRLASPTNKAQLHRLLLDYRMDLGADTPGWYVSVLRGDGTTAVAEYQVPGEAAGAPTYLARRRSSTDAYGEAVDVQLRFEWRSSTAPLTVAEIYDATIEYQATHQRSAA
jgi:hypothetical protein